MFLSDVSSKYGAPMGRASVDDVAPGEVLGRFELARVRLNIGGYDSGGAYWGHGKPLYRARAFVDKGELEMGGMVEWFLRAESRDAAKATVRGKYPNAKFYR